MRAPNELDTRANLSLFRLDSDVVKLLGVRRLVAILEIEQ